MISANAWEWFYYGRTVVEIGLLIWAGVLVTRVHRQMKRMKAIIDEQDRTIEELRANVRRS